MEKSLPRFIGTIQPRCCMNCFLNKSVQGMNCFLNISARREGMISSLLTKRNVSHGKVKGKELTFGSWHGFLGGYLYPVFPSALNWSHMPPRGLTQKLDLFLGTSRGALNLLELK